MRAERAEEEGFFGGGPVACWWVEGRGVGRFWGLLGAREVVACGGDVGGEVLGKIGVTLDDG